MKTIYFIVTLLWAGLSWSGDSSYIYDSNDYDQSTGLLIIPIVATSEKDGLLSYEQQITKNLFIYDPRTKKGRKVFDKYYGQVTRYMLESTFSKDGGEIEYLGSASNLAKNNKSIKFRTLKSSILIETFNKEMGSYTVWKIEKNSGLPVTIFNYKKPTSWHVDAKSGVIRLIQQDHDNVEVKEYAW